MKTRGYFCLLALIACSQEAEVSSPKQAQPKTVEVAPLPSGEIEGKIELSPTLKDDVKPGDVIYIIARSAGTGGILAVQKLTAPASFPLAFKLTGDNVMMPGQSLAGQVKLSARVDKDGDAMSKNPGDVVGDVAEPVTVPSRNVVLTLGTRL